MKCFNATQARKEIYHLIDQVNEEHQPVQINGKRGNAILISEEDWSSINETLHLLTIPDMKASIQEGMNTPLEECSKEPNW